MNATEKFIRDAIEGGWLYSECLHGCCGIDCPRDARCINDLPYCDWKMMLDPAAWQAVGEVRGWTNSLRCPHCMKAYEESKFRFGIPPHVYFMHGLIDALCDGKTTEEYLSSIE